MTCNIKKKYSLISLSSKKMTSRITPQKEATFSEHITVIHHSLLHKEGHLSSRMAKLKKGNTQA
jgi:hypothetical protein